jgi:hypothetical protein
LAQHHTARARLPSAPDEYNAPNAHSFDGKKLNSIHGLVSAPVTVRSHFAIITTARVWLGLLIGESGAFVRR